MIIAVHINKCTDCRHKSHSGSYTPGGAKNTCNHDKAIQRGKKLGARKREWYHWRYRTVDISKDPPDWCPLRHGAEY